jgi:glycine/D-amino acid oxidase-like deaminating enzyme
MPSTRHISGNVSFRRLGAGYMCGNTTYDEPRGFNWEIDYSYFDEAIWPGLAERVPAFEALKVKSACAGHYDENTPDNNAILGPWVGGLENFHTALGFSGHGLMQAPAVGRGLSELLLHGRYQTLDLSRFGYRRSLDGVPFARRGAKALNRHWRTPQRRSAGNLPGQSVWSKGQPRCRSPMRRRASSRSLLYGDSQ